MQQQLKRGLVLIHTVHVVGLPASYNRGIFPALALMHSLTKLVMGEMVGHFEMILKKNPLISALSSVSHCADN